MRYRSLRLPSFAVFLAVILLTMILSRFEENKKVIAAVNPTAAQSVPVLMYHHLLKRAENTRYSGNEIVTYAEDFEQQMRWLKENGFETVTPAALLDWYENGTPLPAKPVLITFDDGYMSNYVYAYPLLKELGYTAVIFSVTEKISEAPVSFHANQINMLDKETMLKAGDVFFYGSHTHNLHFLKGRHSALVAADRATVEADLRESLAALQAYPSAVPFLFSYPYGNYSDAVEAVLRENGVKLAFRAYKGRFTRESNAFELPRYPVSFSVSFKTFQGYFAEYL